MGKKLGLFFFLLALLVARGDPVSNGRETPEDIARPYAFNIVEWEIKQFLSKGFHVLIQSLSAAPSYSDEGEVVRRYFALGQEIKALRALAGGIPGSAEGLGEDMAVKELERDRIWSTAEKVLEGKVSRALEEENLYLSIGPWFRILFPPVDFGFGKPPSVFVTSPRETIRLEKLIILRPNLTAKEAEAIERRGEALGWSALVEPSGGFSTYPTIVPEDASPDFALSTIAHEWLHSYFFFPPLGRHYFDSPEMRTINETAADIGGREIGDRVLRGLFGERPVAAPRAEGEGKDFNFRKEMRQIRLQVDALLAEGKVEEAERFMEERRQFLAQHGYYIRKLNQAYFAFHGTYGTDPASVSPIGGYLEQVRGRSSSLGSFLKTVAQVSRYEDLLKLVGEVPR